MLHFYARRALQQYANQGAVAAQYSFVALFNDSTSGDMLRIRSYAVQPGAGAVCLAFLNQGSLGSLVLAGQSIFAGEPQFAGSLYSGSNATQPTTGSFIGQTTNGNFYNNLLPIAYLRPGWAYVIQCRVVNTSVGASLVWEDLAIDMLSAEELA